MLLRALRSVLSDLSTRCVLQFTKFGRLRSVWVARKVLLLTTVHQDTHSCDTLHTDIPFCVVQPPGFGETSVKYGELYHLSCGRGC